MATFYLVIKLCLTTFSFLRVPFQSSLGIAVHFEPHAISTMCFFSLAWTNLFSQPLPIPPKTVIDFPRIPQPPASPPRHHLSWLGFSCPVASYLAT